MIPTIVVAALFCLVCNGALVIWVRRHDRPSQIPEHKPPAVGLALKIGMRPAEAELILKLNGMMSGGRERP